MQRTQQNLREASKPHIIFRKIKIFQTNKDKFYEDFFEAYLTSRIDALATQDLGAYGALSIEGKNVLEGRTTLCQLRGGASWKEGSTLSVRGKGTLNEY